MKIGMITFHTPINYGAVLTIKQIHLFRNINILRKITHQET